MFDYIKNKDGKKIFAVIDHPSGKGPFGAVLIVHGFTGFSSERHLKAISDSFVEKGFLTIRPDLTKNPGRSYLDFSKVTYKKELEIVDVVLDYLLKMDEVDMSRVGIVGHSLAGMIVGEMASKRKEIKALGILSGVYSFKLIADVIFGKPYQRAIKDFKNKGYTSRWHSELETRLKITKSFLDDIKGKSADKFAKKIKCPTLVISGDADDSVSQNHADLWMKNLGSNDKLMAIIKGADHIYSGEALEKVTQIVASWFNKKVNLKTRSF